eukprot:2497754-Alexandrium_andersonii.AAC.1
MVQMPLLQVVRVVNFDQCQRGAHAVKPTRLIYFGVDVRGGYLAKAAAAYPRELCCAIARLI